MAEHVHKTYSCDRCRVDLGEYRPNRSQATVIHASFNWSEGPGPNYHWTDLCDTCDREVKAFFHV